MVLYSFDDLEKYLEKNHDDRHEILHKLKVQIGRGDLSDFVCAQLYYGNEDGDMYFSDGRPIIDCFYVYTGVYVYTLINSSDYGKGRYFNDTHDFYWEMTPRNP